MIGSREWGGWAEGPVRAALLEDQRFGGVCNLEIRYVPGR